MLTNEMILDAARTLHQLRGYVHIGELSRHIGYGYTYVYKKIDMMKATQSWPYKKNTVKYIEPSKTIIGRVRRLFEDNPSITNMQAMCALGLSQDKYKLVREYLWRLRRADARANRQSSPRRSVDLV